MNFQYVPIDTVLYDLSLSLDPPHYNEHKFREWAIQGYRKLNSKDKYSEKVALTSVSNHKAQLPTDVKYLNQIAYKEVLSDVEEQIIADYLGIGDTESEYISLSNWSEKFTRFTSWKPMKRSTNSFIYTVNLDNSIFPTLNLQDCCDHEYAVDQALCLTTTMKTGYIWVSYLAYATDDNCSILIPDDEDLKDALAHYCMYKFWNSKVITGDKLATHERDWNLLQYQTLLAKASGKLNSPDLDGLENIRAVTTRLLPRAEHARGFYSKLNQIERL